MIASNSLTVDVFCVDIKSLWGTESDLGLETPNKDLAMLILPIQSPWDTELRTGRTEENVVRSLLWVCKWFSVHLGQMESSIRRQVKKTLNHINLKKKKIKVKQKVKAEILKFLILPFKNFYITR